MKKTLKTGYRHRQNLRQQHTKFFPSLCLSGDWLKEAGIEIGTFVTLTISKEQIVIKIA